MSAARDQRFELRLSLAELEAYKRAADRAGKTVSDWIRAACSAPRGSPVETDQQRRDRVLDELTEIFRGLETPPAPT